MTPGRLPLRPVDATHESGPGADPSSSPAPSGETPVTGTGIRERLPKGWQLALFILLYVVLWPLGFSYLVWPVLAIGFLFSLCLGGRVRVPPGFGLWVLFLLWMLASAIEVTSGQRYALFGWRALIYLTATALMLWVYNHSERLLPSSVIASALTILWACAIIGGLVGVVDPTASIHSLAQSVMPRTILDNATGYAYVHPALAQIQFHALGRPIGRPMAFFAYTNQWAAAVGVLTPFAILTVIHTRRAWVRWSVGGLLLVSAIPIIVSINRGLWLALGVGVVYVVVRLAAIGRRRSLLVGLAVLGLVGAGVAVSPLRDIIHTRTTSGQNSNHTRSTLYQEAFAGVAASPLFGNGSPQVSSQTLGGSRVGTQGQFALVLFSHGIPGILFYLGWFAFTAAHALRRRSIDELLWNAAIIVSFVEMAVYDFLPVTLYVLMIACALLWRARQPSAQTTPAVAAAAAYPARSVLA